MFSEIPQNPQENNTCTRVSFLIKLQAEACNFIKKETLAQVFSCEFSEISKNTFSCRTFPVAASLTFRLQLLTVNCFHKKASLSMFDRVLNTYLASSHSEVFLGNGVLKICSKFTGVHPCRSAISIKLLCNFIEIALQHGCSPVNLLHIFRTPFQQNTFEWLLPISVRVILLKVNHGKFTA